MRWDYERFAAFAGRFEVRRTGMLIRCSRIVAAVAVLGAIGWGQAALAQSGPPSGRLSCSLGQAAAPVLSGQRPAICRYAPRRGPIQRYSGTIRNFAIDLGTIRPTTMSWRVYGPYARAPMGALEGKYSTGKGVASTGLAGGPDGEVVLLPLGLQGARGVNAAVGVTGFELKTRERRRR
jgi:hypothetical protein